MAGGNVRRRTVRQPDMKVLPDVGPRPRLLNTAAVIPLPSAERASAGEKARLLGKRILRLSLRISVAGVLALIVAYWMTHRGLVHEETTAFRKVVSVGTHKLSSADESAAPPGAIVVQLNANVIQVTSIALGHPRLAVINGKQVAEGDTVTIHTPSRFVTVTLRVIEIADRRVTLSDGNQLMIAHLTMAKPQPSPTG